MLKSLFHYDTVLINFLMFREPVDGREGDSESPSEKPAKKSDGMETGGDPTYEMACVRRYITGSESISQFIDNSRKMFLLQVYTYPP